MNGTPASAPAGRRPPASRPERRWLLLVHQLPATPTKLRVRTWRRLQQLGAVAVKQAVYVLPDTPESREDFEWLRSEITSAGGEAVVFAADGIDAWSDDALVEEFRRARQEAYAALAQDVERAVRRLPKARHLRRARAPRILNALRERLTALERVDFFGSAGRDRVARLLVELEERTSERRRGGGARGARTGSAENPVNRLWITRPRPGVDRMSSAWLIRRFVDPQARFGFAADREGVPANAMAFDMFGVELSHQGGGCTFETLCTVFGIGGPAIERIAQIVHDLDLKDARFEAPEAPTLGAVIEGLRLSTPDDDALLAQGIALFESLYRSFERSSRASGPRPVARSRPGTSTRRAKGARRPRSE